MGGALLRDHRGALNGSVSLPTSKSLTNRALVAAAVADGGTVVSPLDCDDTRVLAAALRTAGWPVRWDEEIEVGARSVPERQVTLDLAESGTGARLMLALAATSRGRFVIDGSQRLRERPMEPLVETLTQLGAELRSAKGLLPIEIDGRVLEGGSAQIRPEVSSQFVSGLIMGGPLMRRGLDLEVSGPLPSAPYLDLTADVVRAFGGDVDVSDDRRRWQVAPQPLKRTRYAVEGDWSAAAFFLAAVAVAGGTVRIGPLEPGSRQGDRAVLRILADAGLDVDWTRDGVVVNGPVTAPVVADLGNAPDLFPALVAAAACAPPGSRFSGLEHLKHKESDRLAVMVDNLERLGAQLRVGESVLEVKATVDASTTPPPKVTAAGDHRIAMAMAVAALAAGPLELDDPSCVSKSFPRFWDAWDRLLSGTDIGDGKQ